MVCPLPEGLVIVAGRFLVISFISYSTSIRQIRLQTKTDRKIRVILVLSKKHPFEPKSTDLLLIINTQHFLVLSPRFSCGMQNLKTKELRKKLSSHPTLPLYTAWFMGILMLVRHTPYISGIKTSCRTQTNKAFRFSK